MYVPVNPDVYSLVFNGASSGMAGFNRISQNAVAASYDDISKVAGAFAQQFDISWGSAATITESEAFAFANLPYSFWANRIAQPTVNDLLPATWTPYVAAMIAMVVSNNNYLIVQGITSPAWSPSGGPPVVLAGDTHGPVGATITDQLSGTAGLVAVPTAALDFGAIPSLTGAYLRFSNTVAATGFITVRNNANTGDLVISSIDATDTLAFGNSVGATLIQGGGGVGAGRGIIRLRQGATAAGIMVELANVVGTNRVLSLSTGAALTAANMPVNTGDLVVFIGNSAAVPTANAVGGGILYVVGGALHWRGSGGTDTAIGPS